MDPQRGFWVLVVPIPGNGFVEGANSSSTGSGAARQSIHMQTCEPLVVAGTGSNACLRYTAQNELGDSTTKRSNGVSKAVFTFSPLGVS